MNPPSAPRPPVPFFGARAALPLATVLVAGLAVVGGLGMASRSQSTALERFEEMTGFGDTGYFRLPLEAPDPQSPGVATLDGVSLSLVSDEKFEIRDTRMVRAGRDPVTNLVIYSLADGADRKEPEREKSKARRSYYLKSGPEEYLKLR